MGSNVVLVGTMRITYHSRAPMCSSVARQPVSSINNKKKKKNEHNKSNHNNNNNNNNNNIGRADVQQRGAAAGVVDE